jgi:outer membrane receptor protein involved in Fe transport
MRKISRWVFLAVIALALAVMAGTTGKIAGTVVDSETGEPLIGVNVFLEGTSLGAATDENGSYFILQVPPGSYTMKVNYVGYADHEIKNVRVQIDLTTVMDISLRQDIMVGETVVVVAERPIVQQDVANSQMNIEAASIQSMPIPTVRQVLSLQAGIREGSEGVIIRGGSAAQTVFMVDGLSQNDERANIPYTAVSLSSVEEIQINTGGFNAEYGQARSGVVNVITKEGPRNRYTATMAMTYRPAGPKHFGMSVYDPYSYFNRPYMDPAVAWVGTQNGDWDTYTKNQYPSFEGWNAVANRTLQDDDPSNDLTPEAAQRIFTWERRRQGDIKKPDYVFDIGFGGPIPLIAQPLGNLRFYLSYFQERDMFVYPLSRDNYGNNHFQLKLTSDISPSMKLMVTQLYGEIHSVSPYDWTTTPTGRVLRSQSEIADLTSSSNRGMSIPYMPGYFSPSSVYRNIVGIKLTHSLSPKTFYETSLQYKTNKYHTFQTQARDTSRIYEMVPGYFVDEAPYGYNLDGSTGLGGTHLGGWMNLGRDDSKNSTYTFRADVTSQISPKNQLKTGLEFVYNDYEIRSYTIGSLSTWNRTMIYDIFPYRLGMYAYDKIEFEGFIANLSLRMDYSNANKEFYNLDEYDRLYGAGYGNDMEQTAETKPSKGMLTLSPRLGISHPITENSKIYFNYGHYRQEPESSYRFRLQRESNGLVTFIGNPDLKPEKTVAYELGYEHNLFNMFLFKTAAYYKDVTNQTGWIFYRNFNNTVQYNRAANNNYQDIRGLELTLTKRVGAWVTGFVNYTYEVITSGYFGLRQYNEDPLKQRDYLAQNPYQSKPRPRPYARANISFHTPADFGPQVLFFNPLGNWTLNLLADWRTGAYETYNPRNIPGIIDDVQWRDWHNMDLRLTKSFNWNRYSFQFYMDITNLYNHKYMSYAGFSSYNDDYLPYLASLNFPWEEGDKKGNDRIGDYRPVGVAYDPLEHNPNNDPEISKRNAERKEKKSYIDNPDITSLTFLNPRDFRFGIRINF